MVCFFSKHRVEERLASWFLASTVRLDRHEDSVDFSQLLWVIATQGPAAIRLVIHVENTQIYGLRSLPLGRFFLPPCLKQAWGQKETPQGETAQPVNLGILYMDNETNRRWALRCDDPQQLAEIDAVFVTVEPHGGSQKPTGKPFLYAMLRKEANHP